MLAQQLRTIIISLPDPVSVDAALTILRNGNALSSAQSGTVAYEPIVQQTLIDQQVLFDGFNYTVILFVAAGG